MLLANPQLVTRELSEVLAGMPDATKRKAFLEALDGFGDIEKLTTFVDDLANAPELVVALKGRWELVRAWEVMYLSPVLRTNTDNLIKISSYLEKHPNTQIEVNAHFDGLIDSRRYSYINALGYAAQDPISISRARRATSDEISVAVDRIANHRGTAIGGNYGYVQGDLTGTTHTIDDRIIRSGPATPHEPQVFEAVPAEGASGGTWLRNTDSEYKMLNDLAYLLGGRQVGDRFPDVGGAIKIVS